jgi:hypothetical protein
MVGEQLPPEGEILPGPLQILVGDRGEVDHRSTLGLG